MDYYSYLSIRELIRAKMENDSFIGFEQIEEAKDNNTFSYNEARNRKARLSLYESFYRINSSPLSLIPSSEYNENEIIFRKTGNKIQIPIKIRLTNIYLETRCRKNSNNQFFLDLRGKSVENHLKRRIDQEDVDFLTRFLETHADITGLNLCYNHISNRGFEKLGEFLKTRSPFEYLNVMHNDITSINEEKFVTIVKSWSLNCLRLTGNKIGTEGGIAIGTILRKDSSLKHLDLAETDQTLSSVTSIIDSLIFARNNSKLTKLDLSRTVIKTGVNDLCRVLAYALQTNSILSELVLSKNNICDHDFETLLEGLKGNSVLSHLNVSCNRISSNGLIHLTNLLPSTEIKVLFLRCNFIHDEGAIALGRVFSFTKLEFLDISWNQVGDVGITNLIWGINSPIKRLLIYGNKFTTYAVQVIYSQIMNSLLSAKCLDIKIWWDDVGDIQFVYRGIQGYSHWYYCVHDHPKRIESRHCCCSVREYMLEEINNVI